MKRIFHALGLSILIISFPALSADLPDAFPDDIPVADYMTVVNSMQVRDDLMVDFHAPGQTMDGVAEWLIAELTAAGWNNTDDTGSSRSRIMVFMKGDRRCGIMVTNSVMSPSMQIDNSTKGIQMQISGGSGDNQGGASAISSAGADGNN